MKKLLLLLMVMVVSMSMMASPVTDHITTSGLSVTATSWAKGSFSNKSLTSDASYSGCILKGVSPHLNAVQFNGSKNECTGIYTTKSAGVVKSVTIKWSISTTGKNEQADACVFQIYASHDAFSGKPSGTPVKTFAFKDRGSDNMNTYTFDADYEYIAFNSDKTIYIEYIDVEWDNSPVGPVNPDPVTPSLPVVSYNGQAVGNGGDVEVAKGTVLNISSDNATSITVDVDGGDVTTINGASGTFTVNEECILTITGHNGTLSSEGFVAMFTIKEEQTPDPTPVQGNTYKLVTSTADLVDGGKYVIAVKNGADYIAMSNAVGSSNLLGTTVVVANEILTATDETLIFTLEKSGENWIWKFDNYKGQSTSKGLGFETSGNKLSFTTPAETTVAINTTTFAATIKGKDREKNQIAYNISGGMFRNYATSNATGSGYIMPQIYKLVENDTPVEKDYVFPQKDLVSLFVDDTLQINLGEEHPELTFAPVNAEVVSVSANGLVKGLAVGETLVNVSWDAANGWTAGKAIFNVKVRPQLVDPELSFRHAEIHGKLGVGVAAQAAYHKSNGKITYSSSNEAVVKVNPNTGMITPANVFAVGEAVITASIEETETYRAGTANYKVVIENPSVVPVVDDGPVMFDFRIEGCYNFKTNNYSVADSKFEKDFDDPVMSISESVVTMTFDPESQFRSFNGTSDVKQLRIYGGAKFSFEVPEGYAIAKIVFNQISVKSGCNIIEDVADGAAALGAINQKDADQDDDANVKTWREWIANDGVVASKVNFTTATTSGHTRIRTISVVIKKSDSTRQLPELSFATRVYNTYVDTETLVNAATKRTEEDVDIFYSIDNLTDNDYTIFAEDDGNLKVLVNIPGVYTLRAKSNPTENLLAGVAILRLNVFPRLDVVPGEGHLQHHDDAVVLPEDGGSVNFSEVPTTLQVLVDRNDGNDFVAHDWNDINVTEDSHFTYCMEYAETYRTESSDLHVFLMPKQPAFEKNGQLLTLLSQSNTQLYVCAYVYDYAPDQGARRAASVADDDRWTAVGSYLHELTIPELGATELYIVNAKAVKATGHDKVGDLESQMMTVGYDNNGNLSGIESVVVDGAAGEMFFNLQGVRVQGELAPGVYIRRCGSQTSKVVIR